MKFKFFYNTIIILSTTLLSACNELESQFTNDETKAINATTPEERWEYLVVSFGKASFQTIDEGIQNGSSKLTAFREFADLLSGYEGISLQNKLDLLGRFGWELIDIIGTVGGDQQLVLKRERREDRIEKERKVLEKLSVTLKAEKDKKAAELKDYIEKLTSQLTEDNTNDGLVELDDLERKNRELIEAKKAKEIIMPWLPSIGSSICKNSIIEDLKLNVTASESNTKGITYTGSIKVNIDATKELLINTNQYRKSEADKLASSCKNLLFSNLKGYKETTFGGFSLKGEIQVTYKGKTETVSTMDQSFEIMQFPSYWIKY